MSGAAIPTTGVARVRDIVAALVQRTVAPYKGQVFRARAFPLKTESFPAILVYGYEEQHTAVSMNAGSSQFTDVCQMLVVIRVMEASPEAAEAALEILIGAIRTAILQSPCLLDDFGAIEKINSVRTTREIKAEADDVLGDAHIVFEMQWSELYALQADEIDEIELIITMFCQPLLTIDIDVTAPAVVPDPGECGVRPPPDPLPIC